MGGGSDVTMAEASIGYFLAWQKFLVWLWGPKALPFTQARATPWRTNSVLVILRPNGPIVRRMIGPLGRRDALDWANCPGRRPGLGKLRPVGADVARFFVRLSRGTSSIAGDCLAYLPFCILSAVSTGRFVHAEARRQAETMNVGTAESRT